MTLLYGHKILKQSPVWLHRFAPLYNSSSQTFKPLSFQVTQLIKSLISGIVICYNLHDTEQSLYLTLPGYEMRKFKPDTAFNLLMMSQLPHTDIHCFLN